MCQETVWKFLIVSFKLRQKFLLQMSEFWYSCVSRRSTSDLVGDWGKKGTLRRLIFGQGTPCISHTCGLPKGGLIHPRHSLEAHPGPTAGATCGRHSSKVASAGHRQVCNLGGHHPHTTRHLVLIICMNSYSGIFSANSRGIGKLGLKSRRRDACNVLGQDWDLGTAGLALGSHPTVSS